MIREKLNFDTLFTWGFKSVSDRNFFWRLILWTGFLILIVYLLFSQAYFDSYGAFLQANYDMMRNPSDTRLAVEMFRIMGSMMAVMGLMQIVFWAVIASAETAYHKNVFFNEDKGFFPLRFGASELKLMATHLFVVVSMLGAYLAVIFAIVVLTFIAAALAAVSEVLGAILAFLVVLIGIIFAIFMMLYVLARLTPAGALSVKKDRIVTREAWRLTKGRTAPIIGAFLLIILIGYIGIMVIQFSVLTAAFGSDSEIMSVLMSSPSVNPSDVFASMAERMQNPVTKVIIFLGFMLAAVLLPLWYLAMWGVGNRAADLLTRDPF